MKGKQRTGSHEAVGRSDKKRKLSRRALFVGGFLLAFALVVMAASLLRGASDRRSYHAYYTQAETAYADRDWESALTWLRKAIAIDEKDECLLLMADCYEKLGNLDKALELLRRADTSRPEIQRRIATLESARDKHNNAGKLTIAGQEYDPATPALVLKDAGAGDEILEDIVKLYALTNLSLSGNELSDITSLSSLGGLTVLDLSGNNISDISPLSGLSGLRSLYLDGNPIRDFSPLYALSNLTMLSIRGIEITDTQLQALSAALPSCAIHSDAAVETVQEITLGGVTFPADVTELDLSGLGLSDISALSACRELKRLDLTGNKISDLSPLMDIPGLEWLCIKDNQVTDLRPLMALTALSSVNAEGNGLSSTVALGALSSLKELHLAENPLTDTSGLAKLKNLETLGLEETGLRDEDLENLMGLTSLRLLTIYDNPELSGEAVDKLQSSIRACYIQHSPLVYTVEIAGQSIRRNVTELDLSNQSLSDISNLTLLSELEKLTLRGDNLENIYSLQWIISLKHLDLACNKIQDATPLASLYQLETLNVSSNSLTSIAPFVGLTNLKELDLSGNNIPQEELERLRSALPDCNVIFD